MTVIAWLHNRLREIHSIHKGDENSDSRNETFFHPIRLSPKSVGSHPNTNLSPTCLGTTVIAAGFFTAAGAESLHADVAETKFDYATLQLAIHVKRLTEKLSTDAPVVCGRLNILRQELEENTHRNSARHSAVYAKLLEGRCVQFDSNFDATTMAVYDISNNLLSGALTFLQKMKSIAPGLETFLALEGIHENVSVYVSEISDRLFESDPSQLHSATTDLFLTDDPERFVQRAYDELFLPYLSGLSDSALHKQLVDILMSVRVRNEFNHEESLLEQSFYDTFKKFVL